MTATGLVLIGGMLVTSALVMLGVDVSIGAIAGAPTLLPGTSTASSMVPGRPGREVSR